MLTQTPSPRLLIVDDDQRFTRLLSHYFSTEGYQVGSAQHGEAVLQRARAEHWDLIILNVMLLAIDGFEVLRQLREFSSVPVLMLTERRTENDLVSGLDAGADDYLVKTSSARELSARIRALLRRATAAGHCAPPIQDNPSSCEIAVGALRIDIQGHRVRLGNSPIFLTSVELALLADLARHKGRVRTREELIQEARDRKFDSFDRSIDVHIASLRRKLGDHARSASVIRTVRGVGYQLIDPESDD